MKDMPWSWIGRINIVKQGNLKTECNPYQIANGIFHRIGTKNPKLCMEKQKPPCNESNLERENRAGRIRLPDFILYYKAIVIKTVWYCHKKQKYRPMEKESAMKILVTQSCLTLCKPMD